MASRLGQIGGHLSNADDVVIVYAKRTPMTRAKRGGFKDTNPEWLLAAVLKVLTRSPFLKYFVIPCLIIFAILRFSYYFILLDQDVVSSTGINPALIEDVQVGNVLPNGGGIICASTETYCL